MTGRLACRHGLAVVTAVLALAIAGGCGIRPGGGPDTDRAHPRPSSTSAPVPPSTSVNADTGTVVEIIDGDTFDVELTDGRVERIRPPQVDTPERDECGYTEATQALADLINGEAVVLRPTAHGPDRDPHGRLLRSAVVHGDDVGAALIRAGVARWVPRYAHEDPQLAERYEQAEVEARRAERGLWSACGWLSGG